MKLEKPQNTTEQDETTRQDSSPNEPETPSVAPEVSNESPDEVSEDIMALEISEGREEKFDTRGRKKYRTQKPKKEKRYWEVVTPGLGDFEKRIGKILDLGSRKGQVQEIFSAKKFKGLRVNPLLVQSAEGVKEIRDELVDHGIDVIHLAWYPDGFVVPVEHIEAVMELPMYKEGLVFIQNPSSFLPILALDPQPGEKYLDVCSAPGGKAALYAGLSQGKSELHLVDDNPFRVNKKMREVLKSQKVVPSEIIISDARHLITQGKITPESFDKVLVDVDCSSEGKINFESKDPLEQWKFKSADQFSHLQLKILLTGYEALKPGGVLVYSTCTLSPEENEGVISRFLERTPSAIVQKLLFKGQSVYDAITNWPGQDIVSEVTKTLRVDPRDPYMEGFYVCRIIKPFPEDETPEGQKNKQRNIDLANETVDLDQLGQKHSRLKKDEEQQ
ncbi:MAG: RsmB/NOP family class I SAM-dependent RNA methyltransferase [Candidatus Zambryskibacteria bacterium]|nr:RsmB/NOP family class I SAM-dependent RNA methyltransferase [Candidatus Zambryskibacteria bacterium]